MRKLLVTTLLMLSAALGAHAQAADQTGDLCDRAIDEVKASRILIDKLQAELDAANELVAKDAEIIAAKNETIAAKNEALKRADETIAAKTSEATAEHTRGDAEAKRADANEALYKSEKKKNSRLRLENVVLKVGTVLLVGARVFGL